MSKEGNFLIYCIERYKSAKGLTGRQVSELFTNTVYGITSILVLKLCIQPEKSILLKILICILKPDNQRWFNCKTGNKMNRNLLILYEKRCHQGQRFLIELSAENDPLADAAFHFLDSRKGRKTI